MGLVILGLREWKLPSPQPSPGGRGGRLSCLAGCIDLEDLGDYGSVKDLGDYRFGERPW